MNAVIDQLYRGRGPSGGPLANAGTHVQEGAGRMLYGLVRREGLRQTAEVGLAYGASALFVCQALADGGGGLHTAIDPFQDERYDGLGMRSVEQAGLGEHFRWIDAPSHAALAQMLAEGGTGSLDLVFVDGSHKFDYALVDFFYADLLVRPGGFVAFDDLWMPGVLRVVNFVLRNRDYALVPVESGRYSSAARRAGRVLRRLAGGWRLDGRLRRYALNTCVLQKRGDDARAWDAHRSF